MAAGRRRAAMVGAGALAALALVGAVSATAAADPLATTGPAQTDWTTALRLSIAQPNLVPPGMNDPNCRPSAAHPRTVVLLNGAFVNKYGIWARLSPVLAAAGYCVYGLDYGTTIPGPFHQMGDARSSAREIGDFIDGVRRHTGADQVDLVGYSEGGFVPFYYLNELGGASRVHTFVAVASPMRGMSFHGALELLSRTPATRQLLQAALPAAIDGTKGSAYMQEISRHGLTRPNVTYVTISSRDDSVVALNETQLPPVPNMTNIVIQDLDPRTSAFHGAITYNTVALDSVLHAL
ncbi:alpha/beta fold hydrolase [Gordonia sp. L191]|uniref:esterase/lipase family protein n=1 Tax=Gordonia sp. L191 TaxID=2982699 RepID=UPI0024BF6F39|nr:alpha/beta fold hydrolase [Gordonia sp. L191]WHU45577.1 alpha/beta fold hydrolase [Gordonia sp. L191]